MTETHVAQKQIGGQLMVKLKVYTWRTPAKLRQQTRH